MVCSLPACFHLVAQLVGAETPKALFLPIDYGKADYATET